MLGTPKSGAFREVSGEARGQLDSRQLARVGWTLREHPVGSCWPDRGGREPVTILASGVTYKHRTSAATLSKTAGPQVPRALSGAPGPGLALRAWVRGAQCRAELDENRAWSHCPGLGSPTKPGRALHKKKGGHPHPPAVRLGLEPASLLQLHELLHLEMPKSLGPPALSPGYHHYHQQPESPNVNRACPVSQRPSPLAHVSHTAYRVRNDILPIP
jgi:hypothetical protein